MVHFTLNGRRVEVDAEPDTPLLWILRDWLDLTGTKFGCGVGMCGACTVHVGGRATRSCLTALSDVAGAEVTTIEGLAQTDGAGRRRLHPVQQAWLEAQTPQCGYCQSGQIMQAAAMLKDFPEAGDAEIDAAMQGNLCRCMTYDRIRAAIRRAGVLAREAQTGGPVHE